MSENIKKQKTGRERRYWISSEKELRDSAAFAAFKRWLIWDNEMFSEIEQFIPEN